MKPLISICIPTYNRAEVLHKSIESYVGSDDFDDEVEIVISDNASTDNTKEVGEYFSSIYKNIKYFRNKENVRDDNFPLSLDRATGEYLKLMKDNIIIAQNGLRYLKETVKANIIARDSLFFTNGFLFNSTKERVYTCQDFNDFLLHVSYGVTAITFFGCWREQWTKVKCRNRYSKLQLAQDDWVYQLVSDSCKSNLYTKKYFSTEEVGMRSGYNWYEVHVDNYYKILQPYVERGLVSNTILTKEKKTYLNGLKLPLAHTYLWRIIPSWKFDMSGATNILRNNFGKIPYFYWLMMTMPLWGIWESFNYWGKIMLIKIGLRDIINRFRVDYKLKQE